MTETRVVEIGIEKSTQVCGIFRKKKAEELLTAWMMGRKKVGPLLDFWLEQLDGWWYSVWNEKASLSLTYISLNRFHLLFIIINIPL